MTEPEIQVRKLDPMTCHAHEENRSLGDLDTLVRSISEHGQLSPILVTPHPDRAGEYLVLDGARRVTAIRRMNAERVHEDEPGEAPPPAAVGAIVLDRPMGPADVIRYRLTCNVIRKAMAPREVATDAIRYRRLTVCSQGEAARQLNISPSLLSRYDAVRLTPEHLRDRLETLCPASQLEVAMLREAGPIERALDFATTPDHRGRTPSRDAITRFIKREIKGTRPARKRVLKGSFDGLAVRIAYRAGDTGADVVERLRGLANLLARYKHVSPEGMSSILK